MKKVLAGIGLIGLCSLCCGIPTILLGTGIAGFSFGMWGWGAGVVAISSMILFFMLKKKKTTCHTDGSCGCNSTQSK